MNRDSQHEMKRHEWHAAIVLIVLALGLLVAVLSDSSMTAAGAGLATSIAGFALFASLHRWWGVAGFVSSETQTETNRSVI